MENKGTYQPYKDDLGKPPHNIMRKIKFSIRAMFIFEHITGRPFEIKNTMDVYVYYFSCLLAGGEYDGNFDGFIDECDRDEGHIKWFMEELTAHNKRNEVFNEGKEDGKKEGKKKAV